jgi:hypothetical protein
MAAKRQTSSKARGVQNGRTTVDWRSRVHKPVETDPKKRAAAIKRAGSIVKTTARIDTIHPGQEY